MSALATVLARSRTLRGRAFRALPVAGGSSNRVFRIEAGADAFCLRLPRPKAARGIDRAREAAAATAAARAGLGAPVHELLEAGADGPLLLLGWVEGAALAPGDIAEPATLRAAGALLRRLHAGPPLAGAPADYAGFLRAYREDAARAGIALPAAVLAGADVLARVAGALAGRPDGLAPCHDDLVAANLLRRPGGGLVLLDFEYAAPNDPWFDVGTLWSLNGLPDDALAVLCAAYAGGVPAPGRVARARLWALVAHAAFAVWGLLEAELPGAPAGIAAWARAQDARVGAWLADPALGGHVDAVARDG